MQKKKILVITPDTPHPSYIQSVISPLAFLNDQFTIHPVDSLNIMKDVSLKEYYALWNEVLSNYIPHYDAFFGFSFGGVILQQCFSLFSNSNKPIILFSTPSFADPSLKEKLGTVISLCQERQVDKALHSLYQHVYFPHQMPEQAHEPIDNNHLAAERVIYGLNRVLETDATSVLKTCEVDHIHLIGEHSDLVNEHNTVPPKTGNLIKVPGAGMRVLRDNPLFCSQVIREALNREL